MLNWWTNHTPSTYPVWIPFLPFRPFPSNLMSILLHPKIHFFIILCISFSFSFSFFYPFHSPSFSSPRKENCVHSLDLSYLVQQQISQFSLFLSIPTLYSSPLSPLSTPVFLLPIQFIVANLISALDSIERRMYQFGHGDCVTTSSQQTRPLRSLLHHRHHCHRGHHWHRRRHHHPLLHHQAPLAKKEERKESKCE